MPEPPPVAHAPGAHLAAGAKEVVGEVLELVSRGGIHVAGRLRRRPAPRIATPAGAQWSANGRRRAARPEVHHARAVDGSLLDEEDRLAVGRPARRAPASGVPAAGRLSARCRTNGSSSRKSPSAASDAPTPAPGLRSSHVRSKPQPALATRPARLGRETLGCEHRHLAEAAGVEPLERVLEQRTVGQRKQRRGSQLSTHEGASAGSGGRAMGLGEDHRLRCVHDPTTGGRCSICGATG